MAKIRVLIVDDSALMRQLLSEILASDRRLEVVGAAADPYDAREKIRLLKPDLLTLDVEMPRMDGLSFLEKLMRYHPLPVVMVSSLTERGCETTLRALELGAVDFVTKPKLDVATGTVELADELCEKLHAAARVRVTRRAPASAPPSTTSGAAIARPARGSAPAPLLRSTHKVIAVGASTGGTEALRHMLGALPADAPGVVIVQHMPAQFTRSFARRLDEVCQVRVKEAESGDRVLPGHVLIAPGDYHLQIERSGANYQVRVSQEPPVNRHRPSVDVLFRSCAAQLGSNAVGVILTGMGDDGARGLLAMRQAGARTFAQDEASCVVFGMPRVAIECGAVDEVLALHELAPAALEAAAAETVKR